MNTVPRNEQIYDLTGTTNEVSSFPTELNVAITIFSFLQLMDGASSLSSQTGSDSRPVLWTDFAPKHVSLLDR